MIKITFPFNAPGSNDKRGRIQKKKIKARIKMAVSDALWELDSIPRFRGKKALFIYTRHSKIRMDDENLGLSTKFFTDEFIRNGIVKDDKPDHLKVINLSAKGKPKTVVEMCYLDDAPPDLLDRIKA
jgi:hypothetical protein